MLPQRLAHQVLLRMEAAGDSPDDRVQNAVARSKPVRAYADALWPALDPRKLVLRLLTDAELLAGAADGRAQRGRAADDPAPAGPALGRRGPVVAGRRDPDRRGRRPAAAHAQPRARDPGRGPGPVADDAARGRAPGQTGSVTVLGDLAQATTPWATRSWSESLAHLGHPEARGRGAGRRLPRAGRGDRLRRPAAAAHRADADPAALGPAAPRRAGPPVPADPDAAVVGRGPDRAGRRGLDRADRAGRCRGRPSATP